MYSSSLLLSDSARLAPHGWTWRLKPCCSPGAQPSTALGLCGHPLHMQAAPLPNGNPSPTFLFVALCSRSPHSTAQLQSCDICYKTALAINWHFHWQQTWQCDGAEQIVLQCQLPFKNKSRAANQYLCLPVSSLLRSSAKSINAQVCGVGALLGCTHLTGWWGKAIAKGFYLPAQLNLRRKGNQCCITPCSFLFSHPFQLCQALWHRLPIYRGSMLENKLLAPFSAYGLEYLSGTQCCAWREWTLLLPELGWNCPSNKLRSCAATHANHFTKVWSRHCKHHEPLNPISEQKRWAHICDEGHKGGLQKGFSSSWGLLNSHRTISAPSPPALNCCSIQRVTFLPRFLPQALPCPLFLAHARHLAANLTFPTNQCWGTAHESTPISSSPNKAG